MSKKDLLKKLGFSKTYIDFLENYERGLIHPIQDIDIDDRTIDNFIIHDSHDYEINVFQCHSTTTAKTNRNT